MKKILTLFVSMAAAVALFASQNAPQSQPAGGNYEIVKYTQVKGSDDVWIRMYDANENLFMFDVKVSNNRLELESGVTYTLDDMNARYSMAYIDEVELGYTAASITKTLSADGYEINASFTDSLEHEYTIHYAYVKPTKTTDASMTADNLFLQVWDDSWQLAGYNADSSLYISLAVYSSTVSGHFTDLDMEPNYTYIYTDMEFDEDGYFITGIKYTVVTADITTVYNPADSTITVTGTFLCQNPDDQDIPEYTLNLSGRIPRPVYSDMTFTLENTGTSIIVTPSKDDPWDYAYTTLEEFEGVYGGDADKVAQYNYDMYGDFYADYGEYELDFTEIAYYLGYGECVLVVYGCNQGVTTPAAYISFGIYPEDIDNVGTADKAVKVLRNGQLRILRNGMEFNATGAIVR